MDLKKFLNSGGGDLLKKALDSGASSGGALIHEHLEDIITDQIISQYPEWSMIMPKKIGSSSYKHKARNARGSVGGAVGENATLTSVNSTYAQPEIPLKVIARQFSITDFLRDSTSENLDAFAQELENEVNDQVLSLNLYNISGNVVADPYQYSGWDKSILTNRNNALLDGWSSGAATVPGTLVPFDNMINASNRKGGNRYKRAFIMSSDMASLLSRLYTAIRKNVGPEIIKLSGGHELESYRGIPILQSTVISGAHTGTMTTVTAASGGTTGGSLSDGTYYFRVAAITENGESMASAESSVTLAGATATQQINLTFTAYPNAIAYKVFYSASTGLSGMSLIRWSAAKTYDDNGTVTGSVTTINLLNVTADTTVTGISSDKPLTAVSSVNAENIYLVCFDDYQGMGRFAHNNAGQRENGIINFEMLGKTKMTTDAILQTHGAIIPAYEATSVKAAGWRPQ
jgi:hypothetical protein